jgi:hypothetical protein
VHLCSSSSCRWGGIPRYVLEKVDSNAQKLLENAVHSTPLKVLVESVGSQAAPSEASHKLLHLRVRVDFETTCMEMASLYMAGRVAYQLWKNEKENLRLFLSSSDGEGSIGALRGNLWEGFCHARLIEGGQFRIRHLSNPSKGVQSGTLCGPSAPFIFDNWKEIEGKPHGQYFRPRSKTNKSVDSGMQPNILHQITVSKRHDLKCSGMKRAVDSLEQKGPGAVELYFALPPDVHGVPRVGDQARSQSSRCEEGSEAVRSGSQLLKGLLVAECGTTKRACKERSMLTC